MPCSACTTVPKARKKESSLTKTESKSGGNPLGIYTGILQKAPSSFRLHGNPFIILMLQTEGCFRHPSAKPHFVRHRTENRSAEIRFSFSAEWFFICLMMNIRFLQWKETERWPPYSSSHNKLYDKALTCRLKDEGSFLKNLGRESMRDVEAINT